MYIRSSNSTKNLPYGYIHKKYIESVKANQNNQYIYQSISLFRHILLTEQYVAIRKKNRLLCTDMEIFQYKLLNEGKQNEEETVYSGRFCRQSEDGQIKIDTSMCIFFFSFIPKCYLRGQDLNKMDKTVDGEKNKDFFTVDSLCCLTFPGNFFFLVLSFSFPFLSLFLIFLLFLII